jgi:hypothetical protein
VSEEDSASSSQPTAPTPEARPIEMTTKKGMKPFIYFADVTRVKNTSSRGGGGRVVGYWLTQFSGEKAVNKGK